MLFFVLASSFQTHRTGLKSSWTILKAGTLFLSLFTSPAIMELALPGFYRPPQRTANLGFKMDGLKICDNLFWLKGSGKFTLHGMLS